MHESAKPGIGLPILLKDGKTIKKNRERNCVADEKSYNFGPEMNGHLCHRNLLKVKHTDKDIESYSSNSDLKIKSNYNEDMNFTTRSSRKKNKEKRDNSPIKDYRHSSDIGIHSHASNFDMKIKRKYNELNDHQLSNEMNIVRKSHQSRMKEKKTSSPHKDNEDSLRWDDDNSYNTQGFNRWNDDNSYNSRDFNRWDDDHAKGFDRWDDDNSYNRWDDDNSYNRRDFKRWDADNSYSRRDFKRRDHYNSYRNRDLNSRGNYTSSNNREFKHMDDNQSYAFCPKNEYEKNSQRKFSSRDDNFCSSQTPFKDYDNHYLSFSSNKLQVRSPRYSSFKGSKDTKVPDNWLDVTRFGVEIPTTGIIAIKVPLSSSFSLNKKNRWRPIDLIRHHNENNLNIGLIIDLTFTTRYYDPKEFTENGIQFKKLAIPGRQEPSQHLIRSFINIITNFYSNSKEKSTRIAVHCTHGLNRTGYLIVCYLVDHLKMDVEEAIDAFKQARPPGIVRKNFLDGLYRLYNKAPPKSYPPFPQWVQERDLKEN